MDEEQERADSETNDISGNSWTALMIVIALTLAEMDYSPPERRTSSMVLQRIFELLNESFQNQRFPVLTLDEEQDALRLAEVVQNQVQSTLDSIRSEQGDPS